LQEFRSCRIDRRFTTIRLASASRAPDITPFTT
jgi:hypothetical protein